VGRSDKPTPRKQRPSSRFILSLGLMTWDPSSLFLSIEGRTPSLRAIRVSKTEPQGENPPTEAPRSLRTQSGRNVCHPKSTVKSGSWATRRPPAPTRGGAKNPSGTRG